VKEGMVVKCHEVICIQLEPEYDSISPRVNWLAAAAAAAVVNPTLINGMTMPMILSCSSQSYWHAVLTAWVM